MTMPVKQRMCNYAVAPCGEQQYKMVLKADGKYQKVVDDSELPPSKKFELQNMLDAKIPLDEVSSYVIASNVNEPIEPKDEE